MTKHKPDNGLPGDTPIDYAKWMIKWPLIVVVLIAVLICGSVRTVQWWLEKYEEAEVTMMALKCDWPRLVDRRTGSAIEKFTGLFLIKKKRTEETPSALFRGVETPKERDNPPARIVLMGRRTDHHSGTYKFGIFQEEKTNSLSNFSYAFDRNTLEVTYYFDIWKGTNKRSTECTEITEKELLENVDLRIAKFAK